jgi:hypothetical protein
MCVVTELCIYVDREYEPQVPLPISFLDVAMTE